ncbi:cobyrinic acid a,c-diamide synthase [Actinocrinis puniceicyclus]|nr:cobyrinic acid a,c-diamide synthase [Actinocrinis puniceicyclus]
MPAADELFRSPGSTAHGSGSGITASALSTMGSAARAARPGTDRLRAVPDPVDEEPGAYPDEGYTEARAPEQQPQSARVRPATRSQNAAAPTTAARGATGRERHDEKITVYVSPEELLSLEQARILLRAQHGLAVDRGRIVREAIDLVLADFEANGERSLLVRTLRGR